MKCSLPLHCLGGGAVAGLLAAAFALASHGCVQAGDESLFDQIDVSAFDPQSCSDVVAFEQVAAVFSAHCSAISACHGTTSGVGLPLDPPQLRERTVGQPSAQSNKPLIEAGSASASYIVDKLLAREGASLMPPQGPLSEADVRIVGCWIEQGAQP